MGSECDEDVCWICLCSSEGGKGLHKVCGCPRQCHPACLARWQLQQAGKREERFCRFCEQEYPDWKNALTPQEIKPTTPIMAVSVRGRVHKLRVRPGPEGKEDFKRQVRQLLGYSEEMEFDVIFECKTPHSGEKVQLQGFSAFDAATHCAAVSAAKRIKNKQQHKQHNKQQQLQQGAANCSDRVSDTTAQRDVGSGPASSSTSAVVLSPPPPAAAAAGAALTDDFSRLEAQYQHFMQRQQQQQPVLGLAGAARLAASPSSSSSSSTMSPRTSSGSSDGWSLLTAGSSSALQQQGSGLHMPSPASRSVSNASADASAMLTAGNTGSTATASLAAAAVGTAGALTSCPLPAFGMLRSAGSAAGATTAAAGGVCVNSLGYCGALTEPLPALHYGSDLHLLQRPGLGVAGGSPEPLLESYESVGDGSCFGVRKANKITKWFQKITARQR